MTPTPLPSRFIPWAKMRTREGDMIRYRATAGEPKFTTSGEFPISRSLTAALRGILPDSHPVRLALENTPPPAP